MADEKVVLKPCPFCGGEAKTFKGHFDCEVYCTVCGARTFIMHKTIRAAVEHWNRRVSDG